MHTGTATLIHQRRHFFADQVKNFDGDVRFFWQVKADARARIKRIRIILMQRDLRRNCDFVNTQFRRCAGRKAADFKFIHGVIAAIHFRHVETDISLGARRAGQRDGLIPAGTGGGAEYRCERGKIGVIGNTDLKTFCITCALPFDRRLTIIGHASAEINLQILRAAAAASPESAGVAIHRQVGRIAAARARSGGGFAQRNVGASRIDRDVVAPRRSIRAASIRHRQRDGVNSRRRVLMGRILQR